MPASTRSAPNYSAWPSGPNHWNQLTRDDLIPSTVPTGAGLAWSIRHRVEAVKDLEVRDIAKIGLEIATAILNLWYLFVLVIGLLILAFFWVEIDLAQTYGFGSAVLHGFFWVQNGILSWFTGRYMWAPLNTGNWYRAGFIIGSVVLPFFIRIIVEVVVALSRERELRRLRHQQAVHDFLNRRY